MADRPHYIATTNRTVIVPTSVKPKAPLTPTTPNQSGDEVLKYIREKAKHAADYYSSVGLANGDLIRSPHSNSRPKRRSASPEKFSRVSSTWNQPTAPSPSRYGANWVKVRPHTPNRETDPDSYTRPLSTGSTRPDRSQSRSKSTSLDFTALAAGKDTGSAESGASRNVFSHVAHLPAYLIESDRGTGSLERRSRAPTKDERVKSSSLTRMGKPAHFHADNGEGLKDVPRVSSHLHDSVSSFAVATPVEQQGDSIKSAKVELSIQYSVPVAKTPVKNGTSARPKDAEHRRRDRDLSKMKTEIISSSFDSANSLRPSVKSRGFGSASSLDQALANGLNLPDVEPMDLQSKSLPPSTKHIKKVRSFVGRSVLQFYPLHFVVRKSHRTWTFRSVDCLTPYCRERIDVYFVLFNSGFSKLFCQMATSAATQQLESRTSLRNVIVLGYGIFCQINNCFVNVLRFWLWKNAFLARLNGFAGRVCPAGRSLETPDLIQL